MNLEPLNDRVLLVRDDAVTQTPGGIFIPDAAKDKPVQGTLVAVGPGRIEKGERVTMTLKAGDKVLFGKYSGTEIKFEGKDYVLLGEGDILARVV